MKSLLKSPALPLFGVAACVAASWWVIVSKDNTADSRVVTDRVESTSRSGYPSGRRHGYKNIRSDSSVASRAKGYQSHREEVSRIQRREPQGRLQRVPRVGARLEKSIQQKMEVTTGQKKAASRHQPDGEMAFVLSLEKNGLTTKQRIDELRKLKENLTKTEIVDLIRFLNEGKKPEGMSSGQYRWLADEAMVALRRSPDRNNATRVLSEIYFNEEQDVVLRDYAVQHLGHLRGEGGDLETINRVLQEAVKSKQGSIAGTALLAMVRTGDDREEYEADAHTQRIAGDIAKNTEVPLASRVTAFQIAINGEGSSALASDIAMDEKQPDMLRIVAINTLKKQGKERLLSQIASQAENKRILKQLNQKVAR